jgi:hypothetical protein
VHDRVAPTNKPVGLTANRAHPRADTPLNMRESWLFFCGNITNSAKAGKISCSHQAKPAPSRVVYCCQPCANSGSWYAPCSQNWPREARPIASCGHLSTQTRYTICSQNCCIPPYPFLYPLFMTWWCDESTIHILFYCNVSCYIPAEIRTTWCVISACRPFRSFYD